ncbi:MAG: hypothetical protein V3V96_14455 [Acidiferrobacterales bacterium]
MASAVLLEPDLVALEKPQLLHTPSAAQTLIVVAKLVVTATKANFAEAIELLNVSLLGGIRVELWGVGADTNAVTVECYGWPETGGGHHIGQITAIQSTFTQIFAGAVVGDPHPSVAKAFPASSTWRGCDTYVEAADQGVALSIPVTEANFPGYFNVDFTNSQYKWFAVVPTTVGGTNLGAIFTALSVKKRGRNPQQTA